MATFVYRAYDADGRVVDGQVEAPGHSEALESLRSQGLHVESLHPQRIKPYFWQQDTQLTWEDIHLFSNQLASMARSHLPLAAGIRTMGLDLRRSRLKRSLQQLEEDMENGDSLSSALEKQGDAFPQAIVSMLRSGEAAGNLPAVLHLCCQHSRRMSDLKQGIKTAAVYPMFMLFVGTVILGFMMVYVVPMFKDIYLEFGGELPPPTRFLIELSDYLQHNWHIAAVLLTLFFAVPTMVMKRTFRSEWFNGAQDSILHKIPLAGAIHYRVTLARFFQTLATLLHARVPIVESLRLAGAASGSLKLQHIANEIALQQENGFDLSQAMALSHHFTNHMCWLVSMGEKNNDIERSLESLAESLDRETRSLDNIVLLLTVPILTIGIGIVFGFIVVALYLPIFTLGDLVSGG